MPSFSPSSAFPSLLPPSHQCLNMYWYHPLLLNQLLLILHPSPIPRLSFTSKLLESVACSHCPPFLMSHSLPTSQPSGSCLITPLQAQGKASKDFPQMWTSHNSYLHSQEQRAKKKKKNKTLYSVCVENSNYPSPSRRNASQVVKAGGPLDSEVL